MAQSQEDSLRALHNMQSDRRDPPIQAQTIALDAVVRNGSSSSNKLNPYSGLYSDVLSDGTLEQQGMEQQQDASEATAGDDQRATMSRGSDIRSESHSVADEVASNGFGGEEFVDDGF